MTKSLVLLAAIAIGGCATHEKGEPADARHEDIPLADTPAAVKDGFAKEFPGATIKEVEKETYADGTVHYEIEYTGKDGKEHDVEFNADGEKLDEH